MFRNFAHSFTGSFLYSTVHTSSLSITYKIIGLRMDPDSDLHRKYLDCRGAALAQLLVRKKPVKAVFRIRNIYPQSRILMFFHPGSGMTKSGNIFLVGKKLIRIDSKLAIYL